MWGDSYAKLRCAPMAAVLRVADDPGMPNYRRARVPGGSFFFTVALAERRSSLLVDRIDDLRAAFRAAQARRSFRIDAIVVLPEHLHCIWTLPPDDQDFALRWASVKAGFSRPRK